MTAYIHNFLTQGSSLSVHFYCFNANIWHDHAIKQNCLSHSHLCESMQCGLAQQHLLIARGVWVVLVVLKPLDQQQCSLGRELVVR